MADRAVRDSLTRVHPRMRSHWLGERGFEDSRPLRTEGLDSVGLRCIGRWSYGPSSDVDGRVTPGETLVAQSRGSGVNLIRFRRTDSVELELLSDINAQGLMHRVWVRDSLLFVGSAAGLEIWDIADERSPTRLSWTPIPLNDFCVQESLAYVIGKDDRFRVYSVADPESPYQVGVCRDSGYSVAVAGGTALVGDRWGLYLLDVADPANPHRVNSWGSAIDAIATRGALACVTQFNPNQPGELTLRTFHVSDPPAISPLGTLNGAGGYDIHLEDTLVFCSGDANDHALKVVSIADSAHPRLLGATATPGWGMGVWSNGVGKSAFYAAHFEGMEVYDVANATNPVRDTSFAPAGMSVDIDVRGGLAVVANGLAGFSVLDVGDPAQPVRLGVYDTAGQRPNSESAVLSDSFAFVGWTPVPYFRSFDVNDPTRPAYAGGVDVYNFPEDMILRDSLVFVAEAGRLQVVNVARPREPELIGSCGTTGYAWDIDVEGNLAAVAHSFSLWLVNVLHPDSPYVAGMWGGDAKGVDIVDTIAYVTAPYTGCVALCVADPTSPYVLDSLHLTDTLWWNDIAVVGSLAYVGGERIWVVDVSDPRNLRLVPGASWTPPALIRRLHYSAPYLYAASAEAGVCVLESTAVGVAEGPEPIRHGSARASIHPNPTSRYAVALPTRGLESVVLRDVAGRTVRHEKPARGPFTLDLGGLPPGLYFCELRYSRGREVVKLIKR